MPFRYAFSVDTQMSLPYTFSARIELLSKDQTGDPYPILRAQALNSLIGHEKINSLIHI